MAKPNKMITPNIPENVQTPANVVDPAPIQIAGKTPEIVSTPPTIPPVESNPISEQLPPAAKSKEQESNPFAANTPIATVPQVADNIVDLMAEDNAQPPLTATPVIPPTDSEPETEEIKRGRGRPPGSKNKPKSPSTIADVVTPQATPNFGLMGEVVFDMSTNALAVGLGEEWLPSSPQERQLVCVSLAKYFEAQQVKDIPPGMMLALVVSVYALPRLSKPNTATKLKLGWTWLKSKLSRKNPFKDATTKIE